MGQSSISTLLTQMRTASLPSIFLSISAAFIFIALILISISEKGFLVLALNELHTPILDSFFRFYTTLGSGWVLLIIAIITLFIRYKLSLTIVVISIFQGLTSFLFKGILFSDARRPMSYFENIDLQLVDGVNVLYFRSFPSGHTMTAFGIATFLAFNLNKWHFQLFLCLYAIFIAISRIYLALHFLIDTAVGSILGVLISVLIIKGIEKHLNHQKINGKLSLWR